MKIRYTKHAEHEKFAILKRHGFRITKKMIMDVLLNPHAVTHDDDFHQSIAGKRLNGTHELRVVYRTEDDILIVITFYPTRIGRYSYEN